MNRHVKNRYVNREIDPEDDFNRLSHKSGDSLL